MGLFDLSSASEDLADLLERERAAVLSGRFDQLERLSSEKERLVRIVSRDGAPAGELDRLKASSDRNAALLDAMRDGVLAAQARLKSIKNPPAPLSTYNATGQKQEFTKNSKPIGRRA